MTNFNRLTDQDWSLLPQAADHVVRTQFGSVSMIRRKMGIGFAQACLLMDCLEELKVVGPASVSPKAREVLIDEGRLKLLEHDINIERGRADAAG